MHVEPKSFEQPITLVGPDAESWKFSMEKEIKSLGFNRTRTLVLRDPNVKANAIPVK